MSAEETPHTHPEKWPYQTARLDVRGRPVPMPGDCYKNNGSLWVIYHIKDNDPGPGWVVIEAVRMRHAGKKS